jgi:hypothetical protein
MGTMGSGWETLTPFLTVGLPPVWDALAEIRIFHTFLRIGLPHALLNGEDAEGKEGSFG